MRFKDYGISTIIIIDDIYNEINEDDLLSDFPPEVIEELTNGEYDKYKDYSISKERVEYIERIEPIEKNHHLYMEYFNLFKSLYKNVKNDFASLADIVKRGEVL